MAETKTIEAMKSPSGNPVRVEEAWKDANGGLLTDKALKSEVITLEQQNKVYDAVKTVTKDFTRTDPVYVRIGDDGEPEIHYTITQADASSFFRSMKLPNVSLHIHNCKNITAGYHMFYESAFAKITLDTGSESGTLNYCCQYYSGAPTFIIENVVPMTDLRAILYRAYNTHTAILRNCGNVVSAILAFDYSGLTHLILEGITCSFDVSTTQLEHDAILDLINNLGTAGENATLTLGATKLALMSDEEKAIATGKGWTLA